MDPGVIAFVIDGPIERTDIPGLCDRFRTVLPDAPPGRVVCQVGPLCSLDAVTVEALVRLKLVAKRLGRQFVLVEAADDLRDLVAFMGLRPVLLASLDQASRRGGRPKSGKMASVSRKKVIPAIPPSDSSST